MMQDLDSLRLPMVIILVAGLLESFLDKPATAQDLMPADPAASSRVSTGQTWTMTFAKDPQGNSNAAILRTADIDRSDPLFAGLMLRCAVHGLDVVAVVLKPYPPRARPRVSLRASAQTSSFDGTVIPTGAGILLPVQGSELVESARLSSQDLTIKIADEGTTVEGVVQLAGLPEAASRLMSQCSKK